MANLSIESLRLGTGAHFVLDATTDGAFVVSNAERDPRMSRPLSLSTRRSFSSPAGEAANADQICEFTDKFIDEPAHSGRSTQLFECVWA